MCACTVVCASAVPERQHTKAVTRNNFQGLTKRFFYNFRTHALDYLLCDRHAVDSWKNNLQDHYSSDEKAKVASFISNISCVDSKSSRSLGGAVENGHVVTMRFEELAQKMHFSKPWKNLGARDAGMRASECTRTKHVRCTSALSHNTQGTPEIFMCAPAWV